MKNTEYKCKCCGWLGRGEEFGISADRNSRVYNLETCPQCGSMDIVNVILPMAEKTV